MLAHDEAISLLAAAGKSAKIDALYEAQTQLQVYPAGDLQRWLRPSSDSDLGDVFHALAGHDIHPPLYFAGLYALQRIGLDHEAFLRMLGVAAVLAAGWVADRYLWPDANLALRLAAFCWLTVSPVVVAWATELRQYGFVQFGVVLSLAAVVTHWDGRISNRRIIALMAAAPVVLLWSQLGTAIWIVAFLTLCIIPAIRSPERARGRVVWSIGIASLFLLPLGIWWATKTGGVGRAEVAAPDQLAPRVLAPAFASLGRAWLSIPGRWHDSIVWPLIGAAAVAAVLILAARSAARVDRWLCGAALFWFAAWLALIALGRIPPHAHQPKHLTPIIVVTLFIVVRAARRPAAPATSTPARLILAGSLLSLPLGWYQLTAASQPRELVNVLRRTDCLMATSPRRGYLFPLVDLLPPDATVILGSPEVLNRFWPDVRRRLPEDRLVLAQIDAGRCHRGPSLAALTAHLEDEYDRHDTVRREPVRTLMLYRGRRGGSTRGRNAPVESGKTTWPRHDRSSNDARR